MPNDFVFNKALFADLLKEAIGNRSINQYAMNCGVSATYISKLLRSLVKTAPGVDIIKKFSEKAYNEVAYEDLMIAAGHLSYSNNNELLVAKETSADCDTSKPEFHLYQKFRKIGIETLSPEDQEKILEIVRRAVELTKSKNKKKHL